MSPTARAVTSLQDFFDAASGIAGWSFPAELPKLFDGLARVRPHSVTRAALPRERRREDPMLRDLRRASAAALALSVCLTLTGAATAQINPFRRSDTVALDKDDMQIMRSAASKLTQKDVPVGQTETWQNPKSGRSGSVSLLQSFKKNGMPCQKRRYVVDPTVKSQGSEYVMTLCRVPTGEWKLA
jgi:surface antigen